MIGTKAMDAPHGAFNRAAMAAMVRLQQLEEHGLWLLVLALKQKMTGEMKTVSYGSCLLLLKRLCRTCRWMLFWISWQVEPKGRDQNALGAKVLAKARKHEKIELKAKSTQLWMVRIEKLEAWMVHVWKKCHGENRALRKNAPQQLEK